MRQGVQSHRHPWGFYLASDDPQPYWTFSRDANTTARAAGLFAQAAGLVASYDPARAGALKQRAVRAWEYADRNGAGNACRLYGRENSTASPVTESTRTLSKSLARHGTLGAFSDFAPYQLTLDDYKKGKRSMADFVQGYARTASNSAEIAAVIRKWLTTYADQAVRTTEIEHAYRNPRPERFPMDWARYHHGSICRHRHRAYAVGRPVAGRAPALLMLSVSRRITCWAPIRTAWFT